MDHRYCGFAALTALLLAGHPALAGPGADGADPHCSQPAPFREVAEDETRSMLEICGMPSAALDDEVASPPPASDRPPPSGSSVALARGGRSHSPGR